jgi:hypothetical protein
MGASLTKDMAICVVVFNPTQSKRIIMNYLYMKNQFKLHNIPFYTMELVYEGREPELKHAFHVHTKSVMFHKENLFRLLEKKVPAHFTKLAFLDCDILFQDKSWYEKTSKLLDTHDIVQPFETAYWLDLTYKNKMLSRKTILHLTSDTWDFKYHPGFAWCMRRDWYRKVGFFDYAISGSGDTLSCAGWMKKKFPEKFQSLPSAIKDEYAQFYGCPSPRITFLEGGEIHHLYHGSRINRQYADRHKMLNVREKISELLVKNAEGVFEWREPEKWNPVFKAYFEGRQEDDLSSIELVEQKTKTS